MIENRELTMDDYLAMLRRRLKVILIPALLTPLVGFLISYAFPAKYTSQSTILVEMQKVPEGYVKPVVTEDISQRIATMQQQVLSRNQLQPMIERLQLTKRGKSGTQRSFGSFIRPRIRMAAFPMAPMARECRCSPSR